MHSRLGREIEAFSQAKEQARREGATRAALQRALGMDPDALLAARGPRCRALLGRLSRAVRRERHRGLARAGDYDLDRHIALGRMLARMKGQGRAGATAQFQEK